MGRQWILGALCGLLLAACGDTVTSPAGAGAVSEAGASLVVNWQSLGCEEPVALVVEASAALDMDAGLAADSIAESNGVSRDEAKRRFKLQTVLSQRLSEIQAAESGRVAYTELQHKPYFAAIATLTGTDPVGDATRELLCRTPELEVHLGARFTQDELTGETIRLSEMLGDFASDVPFYAARNGRLEFTTLNDATRDRLDQFLADNTTYPYEVTSLGIAELSLDPDVPFPLLDVTGKVSTGVGLMGLLTIEGPCVYLNEALVVLPARETTWNPETGVLNTGGGDMRSGDQVIGGGDDYDGALEDLDQPPDPQCRTAGGVLQGSFARPDPNATPAPVPPTPTPEEANSGAEYWESVPTVVGGEALPGAFWTGSEVVVLRTENMGTTITGERWNPASNEVRRVADPGLVWRAGSAMVWTGEEVLVVGGSNGPGLDQIGTAYNPTSDTWRPLADPPGAVDGWANLVGGPAVWTGNEMIIWRRGLAYQPATDSWRSIAESPLSPRNRPAIVWTGTELVVWGGCSPSDTDQCDEMNSRLLDDGARYDPDTDTWTALPTSPLTPAVHMVAAWTGSEMILVVTDPGDQAGETAATFSPERLEWTVIDTPPLDNRRFAAAASTGNQFVIWGGGDGTSDKGAADGAAYNPLTDEWAMLPAGPGPGRALHSMIYAGDRLYVSATRTVSPPLQLFTNDP